VSRGDPVGPHVVCSVLPERSEDAAGMIERAPAGCGLVELRADRLRADEITRLVRGTPRPLIVTQRRRDDGGSFEGSEEERESALGAALDAGAAFVDLEWDRPVAALAARPRARGRTILSHHGVPCRLDELRALHRRMSGRGATALKIAAVAEDVDQLLALRDVLAELRGAGPPVAAFALGRAGALSRLLAPCWGSWATFGALTRGAETGPGQYTAAEMLEPYDVLSIGRATRLHALVGSRVAGSPSPAMHLAGYRSVGLDARYFAVETDDLAAFARLVAPEGGLGLAGFGVTMPFKERAAARCTAGDTLAALCGAVNTVVVAPEGWTGFNTDGPAALECLREHIDPRGARVAILGAGGTARAVAAALVGEGAAVTFFNRSVERAREAARRTGAAWAPLDGLAGFAWDVLVQATPQGADGEPFLDPGLLGGRVVLDAVYGPRPTALVREARRLGLAAIDGLDLLAAQGALQFRRLTGRPVGRELLRCTATAWIAGGRLDAPGGPE